MRRQNINKGIKKTKKYIFIVIVLFFVCCLIPNNVKAQQTCEQKYPGGDGNCAEECKDWEFEDNDEDLCADKKHKCCHEFTATSNITLQIPVLQYQETSNIYEYIANIYAAALYIIIPITIVVIIISGIIWASSGGNPEQMQSAKNMILRAFIGLGIAIFSYVMLSMIGIRQLNPLNIDYVENYDIETELPEIFDAFSGSLGYSGNMPVYRQGCDRTTRPNTCPYWASKQFGPNCGTIFAKSGCGATAFAMVISSYGLNKDPYQAGQEILVPNGCRGCSGGTDRYCFDSSQKPKALNSIGFKGKQVPRSQVVAYLQAGKPLIATVGPTSPKIKCNFTGWRHFIALASSDGTNITVHDPNGRHPSPWVCPVQDVLNASAPAFFYIAPESQFSPL